MSHVAKLPLMSNDQLDLFLEAFRHRAKASKNRFWLDLFCIVETEMLSRHHYTSVEELTDHELGEAAERLKDLIDDFRISQIPDDYPPSAFVLLALNLIIGEIERREKGMAVN